MARRAARAKPGGMGFERLKRPYDRVVSAVLVHVLALSVVALGLGELAELAAVFTGDAEAEWLWRRIAESAGTSDVAVRLVVFGVAQALIAVLLWRPVGFVRERLVVALDGLPAGRVGTALGVAGTALLTGVLLPFVLQPGPSARRTCWTAPPAPRWPRRWWGPGTRRSVARCTAVTRSARSTEASRAPP
jgi:hypothetical protein